MREIEVVGDRAVEVIYVQPSGGEEERVIGFDVFARYVEQTGGELGKIFADHLLRWTVPAGMTAPAE